VPDGEDLNESHLRLEMAFSLLLFLWSGPWGRRYLSAAVETGWQNPQTKESRLATDPNLELLSCLSLFDPSVRLGNFLGDAESWLLPSERDLHEAIETRDWCHQNGIRILYPSHPHYPQEFLALEEPPLFLSCLIGAETPPWQTPSISIVGSREPLERSLAWMDQNLPQFLRLFPVPVISGGARGVDQKAHSISLRSGIPTVAVIPSGLARIYPGDFAAWVPAILEAGGALLSPYHPKQEIRKFHFEGRNRLIAALGKMLLVIEARRRSGSIMTARLASELGRTLAALPSFPGESRSAGSLELLFSGGMMVRDAGDLAVLYEMSRVSATRK
jgi:DNA processing protein